VAQGGAFAAREDCCHPVAFPRQLSSPDRIDAAELQRVEAAGLQAVANRLRAEIERDQLSMRNHAMLLANDGPHCLMIDRGPYRGSE
jgi:predicted phosphoribosyltransferase